MMQMHLLKAERLYHKIRKRLVRRADSNRVYLHQRIAQYREFWRAAATRVGAQFTELSHSTWQVERDGRRTRMVNHETEFDNPVTLLVAGNKPLIHKLLAEHGLPVPAYTVFSLAELGRAERFQAERPEGTVIKPVDGAAGLGVTTHVETRAEVRRAAVLASLYSTELMIEAQVPGECYRLLILEGKMIHAVCRRVARLRGDGVSTVLQLIQRSRNGAASADASIAPASDRNLRFTLRSQGLSLDSVVEAGREFVPKTIPDDRDSLVELRTVYNATVTDEICSSLRESAELAARVVGSAFVGVDVITTDPRVPLAAVGGVINELNTTPALHHHYNPETDAFPSVAIDVLEALLRRSPEMRNKD